MNKYRSQKIKIKKTVLLAALLLCLDTMYLLYYKQQDKKPNVNFFIITLCTVKMFAIIVQIIKTYIL